MAKLARQVSPKVLSCIANGRKGGLARAKKYSRSQTKAWSSLGGRKLIDLYGSDIMRFLERKKTVVGRYNTPRKKAR